MQEVKVYTNNFFGYAHGHFQRDMKKRLKRGWKLMSVTPTQSYFGVVVQLTAIYEKV